MSGTETTRRPRRIRRRWRVLIAILALLPLLAVGADFGVRAYAQSRIEGAVQTATGAASAHAHIRGFPVLTQLVRGSLEGVDISAQQIPSGSQIPITISELDVHMTSLAWNSNAQTARAGYATATAYITYQDLSNALGINVAEGSTPGRITATATVPLVGELSMDAAVTKAGPTSIAFKILSVSADQLPQSAQNQIDKTFQQTIPLRNIPHGMTLERISTGSSGISATLSGHDVSFKASSSTGSQSSV
jgi:hypothetical protein